MAVKHVLQSVIDWRATLLSGALVTHLVRHRQRFLSSSRAATGTQAKTHSALKNINKSAGAVQAVWRISDFRIYLRVYFAAH